MADYRYADRQYDISKVHNFHVTLPLAIPYRLSAEDYVFFNYPSNFPAQLYSVVVESASNASPNPLDRFRSIGDLQYKVELPNVYFSKGFGSHASILVLPKVKSPLLKPYIGDLVRGSTYTIDLNAPIRSIEGHRELKRTGVY